ncbi:hypothetical protein [Microbacterium arborescens]|uniref:hypothetical protein n=1 Tax=Microbacterium arborescens TaxID=33883 RepID=UPI0013B40C80|nr:hypothetical protein [Microbacterium arborescens]
MTDVSVHFDTRRSSATTIVAASRMHSRGGGEQTRHARGMSIVAVLAFVGFATVGCAVAERPTLERAKAETQAVLQQIADEVPDGVVEVRTPDSAYLACDGGGYYSINHWVVTPGPGFGGEAFVDALPERLGDGFVVAEVVDIKSPAVALNHVSGAALDVVVLESVGGVVVVDLLGLAPCGDGEPPTE